MCNSERTTGRGSRWKSIREDAKKSTPFCSLCGAVERLEVHHIIPFRLTYDNGHENLIPLCKRCHKKIEIVTQELLMVESNYERLQFMLKNILHEIRNARILDIKRRLEAI